MAGDWIKMRTDLGTSPKVVRMASALKADRLRTIGGLHSAWSLFDAHSDDGVMAGYTPEILDELIGWPGFAGAMIAVEWLLVDSDGLALPRFDTHNGASAKRRAQDADRKRNVRSASAPPADKKRTRGEERRSTEPNGSGADAPDPVWGTGLAFLKRKGIPEKPARSLLGQLRKAAGDIEMGAILARAVDLDITDPAPWLMKAAQSASSRASGARPLGQVAGAISDMQEMKRELDETGDLDGVSGVGMPQLGAPAGT